ncbi:Galactose 1-dehydrogenase [Methylobacterium sp. 4-46]|uniref:Gfo/Idh/MocA family protein n=1 Tax=unclassified Methylobacterium TaxID=2615210 RepID=UPI000165CB55|nr:MULTISPECIES: Gfo/Idh/MocA family oxidoreductase [Methylobacterium]ACA18972.1 Galactose 1-dehydrogenase [Methylobacterium sp. 4-46]WFT78191.1 Gfo/Idh/MocA family oxidoreductase [Methylobacterium nodulans]
MTSSPTSLRIALVGLGKIARDQHLPAIAATPGLDLAATAGPGAGLENLPHAPTLAALLESGPPFDAVALCTPPRGRGALAAAALAAGKHVLLEKPPAATLGEILPLAAQARAAGLSLFCAWHSRFAPAVEPARAALRDRPIRAVRVDWREDIRVWHPGQDWILEPGGLGVFDPGINALSLVTHLLPRPVQVTGADLAFPADRQAPIAAALDLADAAGLPIRAEFDFLQAGPQTWDIRFATERGLLLVSGGGARLSLDGVPIPTAPEAEYRGLYRRFRDLVSRRESEADLAPLGLVADAFMIGRRRTVAAFGGW